MKPYWGNLTRWKLAINLLDQLALPLEFSNSVFVLRWSPIAILFTAVTGVSLPAILKDITTSMRHFESGPK